MKDINATETRLVTALQARDQNGLSFASECGASAAECLLGELYKHAHGTGPPFRAPGVGPGLNLGPACQKSFLRGSVGFAQEQKLTLGAYICCG